MADLLQRDVVEVIVKAKIDPTLKAAIDAVANANRVFAATGKALAQAAKEGKISTDEMRTAMDGLASALGKGASNFRSAGSAVKAASDASQQSMAGWVAAMNQLEAELTTLPAKLSIVKAKLSELAASGQQGSGAWGAYITELKRLEDVQRKVDAVNRGSAEGYRHLRFAVQNTAYQFQDMAVQLQMGTRASVVMAQQIPQVLGAFGAFGAVAGVVVALAASLAGPLVDSLFKGLQPSKDLEDAIKATDSAFKELEHSATGLNLDNVRKQFNESSAAARQLIVATKAAERALAELARTQADKAFSENAKDLVGSYSTLDKLAGSFGDQNERNAKRLGIDKQLYLDLAAAVQKGYDSSALVQYTAALAKGGPEAQKFARSILEAAKAQGDAAAKASDATKLLDQFAEAGDKGVIPLDKQAKAAKGAKEALRDWNQEMTLTREVFQEMAKIALPKFELEPRSDIIRENMDTWEAWGITQEQIAKKLADAEEAARRSIGTWSMYDDVVKNLAEEQRKFNEYILTGQRIAQLAAAGLLTAEAYQQMLVVLQKLKPALAEVGEQAKKTDDDMKGIAQALGNIISSGIKGLVDALMDSTKSFREWAASFLKESAKILVQLALLAAAKKALAGTDFGGLFGFAHGAAMPKPVGLPQGVYPPVSGGWMFPMTGIKPMNFAQGATFGRLAEAGRAEAIVPLVRHGGDLGVKASPVNIQINNNVSDQAEVKVVETNRPDGSRDITLMIERQVKQMLGNGTLDTQMRMNYGATRKPMY